MLHKRLLVLMLIVLIAVGMSVASPVPASASSGTLYATLNPSSLQLTIATSCQGTYNHIQVGTNGWINILYDRQGIWGPVYDTVSIPWSRLAWGNNSVAVRQYCGNGTYGQGQYREFELTWYGPVTTYAAAIPWARQSSVVGGVDLIKVCLPYGYAGASYAGGHWYCDNWLVNWDSVCKDTYDSSYIANYGAGGQYDIRCVQQVASVPTQTPSYPTPYPSYAYTTIPYCPGAPGTQFYASPLPIPARSTAGGAPLRIRATPGGDVLTHIYSYDPVTIIGGAVCFDGMLWWEVMLPNGLVGWVAEGDMSRYYIEPVYM